MNAAIIWGFVVLWIVILGIDHLEYRLEIIGTGHVQSDCTYAPIKEEK